MNIFRRIIGRGTEFALLLAATIIITVVMLNLYTAQGIKLNSDIGWVIGGFIGVFTIAHLTLCFLAPQADQFMLPVAALVNGLGLAMIHRIDLAEDTHLVSRQVMWMVVGIGLLITVLVFLRDHRSLQRYSYVLGAIGLFLLAMPLWWPFKGAHSDAKIWVSFGPISLQPGEFSKILLLLFFAQLLVTKRTLFNLAGKRFLGLEFPRLRDLAPILGVWGFAILIMAGENDFGPALLLFSTVLGMLYLSTNRVSWLLIGTVLVVVGGTAVYQVSRKIQDRFSNFLDPIGNYDTTGYQLSQALFGMSTGGVTGSGFGSGFPQNVPVAESDFILAAIGEEMGLVGLAAVLILFTIFISRGMNIALKAKDVYGKLLASGLSLTLAVQIFVVTAGISALMPMTGLTTPFMSQGGSSLMANYILLAIMLRISDASRTGSMGQQVVKR